MSSKDGKTTIQRSAYRATMGPGGVSSRGGAAAAAPAPRTGATNGAGQTATGSPSSPTGAASWEVKEPGVCDTWGGLMAGQFATRIQRSRAAGRTAAVSDDVKSPERRGRQALTPVAPANAHMSRSNLLATLSACIASQNEVWEGLRVRTISERRAEEARRQQQLNGGGAGTLENTLSAMVLQRLGDSCAGEWQDMLTTRMDDAVAFFAQEKEREEERRQAGKATNTSGSSLNAMGSNSSPGATPPLPTLAGPPPALPSVDDLYDVVVRGLNGPVARSYVTETMGVEVESSGIDAVGLVTVFDTHIQALTYWYPTVAPGRQELRTAFADLDPRTLSCKSNAVEALETSLEIAEVQLDRLLRSGESIDAVADVLLSSVHPSMRRLLYPRAFAVPMHVTDGAPLFPPENGFTANHHGSDTIPGFLTCATKRGRDKVRRRFKHSFSSPIQEARARTLQQLLQKDVLIHVGDSDKYFIYQDDVDAVGTALVLDRGLPVDGLQNALQQLGRGDNALDAYVVYLKSQEGDVIHQKALPCGVFPMAGTSMLIAPVCNMTGDTVEQYQLSFAMYGALWSRLQGPTPELLQCCFIFEKLITELALPATLHATRVLQAHPLRLALNWMVSGFADVLDPFELLLLWDWITAFHVKEMHGRSPLSRPVGLAKTGRGHGPNNSRSASSPEAPPCALWLLPVLAAGLFAYRAPLVLKTRTKQDMEALFVVNHHVSVRAIIQACLFTDVLVEQ